MFKKHLLFWILPIALLLVIGGCNSLQDKPAQNPLSSEPTLNPGDSLSSDNGGKEPTGMAASTWWDINQRIWSRAHQDIGHDVNEDCKNWATAVVHDVTGYWLPSTQGNGYYLNSGAHISMIVDGHTWGGGTIEQGIGVGNIIQMRLKTSKYTGPHTAIFYRYGTYNGQVGMFWIDSNWFTDTYPNYVYVHFVSFAWFRTYVGSEYSVYQVYD